MWKGERFLTWGWSWPSGSWFWDGGVGVGLELAVGSWFWDSGVGAGGATPQEALWVLRWQRQFIVLEFYFYLKGFNRESDALFFLRNPPLPLLLYNILGFCTFPGNNLTLQSQSWFKGGFLAWSKTEPSAFHKSSPSTESVDSQTKYFCIYITKLHSCYVWILEDFFLLWKSSRHSLGQGAVGKCPKTEIRRSQTTQILSNPVTLQQQVSFSMVPDPSTLKSYCRLQIYQINFKICVYSFQNNSTPPTC